MWLNLEVVLFVYTKDKREISILWQIFIVLRWLIGLLNMPSSYLWFCFFFFPRSTDCFFFLHSFLSTEYVALFYACATKMPITWVCCCLRSISVFNVYQPNHFPILVDSYSTHIYTFFKHRHTQRFVRAVFFDTYLVGLPRSVNKIKVPTLWKKKTMS